MFRRSLTLLTAAAMTAAGTLVVSPASVTAFTGIPPVISEVMFNPASAEDDWEWIELHNPDAVDLDLAGWVVDDINSVAVSGSNIAAGTVPAGGSAILYNADDLTAGDFEAAWGAGINLIAVTEWGDMALNNGGDTIGLWETVADYSGDQATHANAVISVAYDGTIDDGTGSVHLTDLGDQASWALSTDGLATPVGTSITAAAAGGNGGADIGSPVAAPVAASDPVLSEVMYDPASAEDDWEWVELHNPGAVDIDLTGWVIDDINGTAVTAPNIAAGSIPAGGSAILYNADDVSAADMEAAWGAGINLVAVTGWSAMALNNSGDTIGLWDDAADHVGDQSTHANAVLSVTYPDSASNGNAIHLTDLTDQTSWVEAADGVATPVGTNVTSTAAAGNVGGEVGSPVTGPSAPTLPFTSGFDTDDCTTEGWQVVSVDADTGNTWSCTAAFSNADVNGFGDSAAADEWLISPAFDLDATTDETLDFRNYTNFTDAAGTYPQLEVVYATDYDGGGDPSTATWTALPGITFSPEDSASWVDSGTIDLSGIAGSAVSFAFHYTSTGTGSGTAANWRIDEVDFAIGGGSGTPTPAEVYEVQGSGSAVAITGEVEVTAIVTTLFEDNDVLDGFFIQEAVGDGDASTSDGIFVFCRGNCPAGLAVGDAVTVIGEAEEFFGMSQIDMVAGSVTIDSSGNTLPAPTTVTLPASGSTEAEATFESIEGMVVEFPGTLAVAEYFQLARYGQVVLHDTSRPYQFTHTNAPDAAGYAAFLDTLATQRIILDDNNNDQNDPITLAPDEAYYYPEGGLDVGNRFRGGDTITGLTGVMHWSFAGQTGTDAWRIRPIPELHDYTFTSVNPAPASPDPVGGSLTVATLNVLNYFVTLDVPGNTCGPSALGCRGANSEAERVRQLDKIVAALVGMDADIVGLVEIENDDTAALQSVVDGVNAVAGAGTYDFIDAGPIGGDAIKVGLIYKPATVTPFGAHAILDSTVDPTFIDTKNRPVLIQTFDEIATGERLTIAVNHLKSKGSDCDDVGDPDLNDGQARCPKTRTDAAVALANYLATDPTGSGDPDFLIVGDLNSYKSEDPIVALESAGYSDLLEDFQGADAYTYVFDGQLGYLDYAMSNTTLTGQVTGTTSWHINADEIPIFDYNDDVLDPNEDSFERESSVNDLYDPDELRASDHDAVIVGLDLFTPVVSIGSAAVMESFARGDWVPVQVPITMDRPVDYDVTVTYSTVDTGSASDPEDYQAVSNVTVTIPAGKTWQTAWVFTKGDMNFLEGDETVDIQIDSVTNAEIGVDTGTITIRDRLQGGIVVSDVTPVETDDSGATLVWVTIAAGERSPVPITVDYFTQEIPPPSGSFEFAEWLPRAGQATIPANGMFTRIQMWIRGDLDVETAEDFRLLVLNPSASFMNDPEGFVTQADND